MQPKGWQNGIFPRMSSEGLSTPRTGNPMMCPKFDYFKQDQIDWYSRLVDYTTTQNGGTAAHSLMFYHIPLPEVRDAWEAAKADSSLILNPVGEGEQNEEPCNPDYNSGFYKVIKEKGSTHGMYFGHDHINNYIINYDGIHFG